MNFRIKTNFEEMCLAVTVAVSTPTVVRIKIYDSEKENIIFTDRYKTVRSKETFFVRMPMTSECVILSVYDDKKGNTPKDKEHNIRVISVDKQPLQKRMDVVDIRDTNIANFVDFAQRFCYNSGYLKTNKIYQSDDGRITIEYLEEIIGRDGRTQTTPARISKTTGRIQVSKKYFDRYTIPMKFAILCHEFSHFYVNENPNDESEADLNGLLIYLGLGYPRIEGYQAFLEVFKDSPTQQNKQRYDKIDSFIRNFEKNNMVIKH